METNNNQIAPYLEDVVDVVGNIYNAFGLDTSNTCKKTIEKLKDLQEMIEYSIIEALAKSHVKTVDAFDKPFKMGNMYYYLMPYVSKIIDLKLKNPDMPIEDLVVNSGIKFSVEYLNGDSVHILNIPADIYKFLVLNNYDSQIKDVLHTADFGITYNYIDIFKKVIRIGANFEDKNRVVNSEKPRVGVVTFVENKLNTVPSKLLCYECNKLIGHDNYVNLVDNCEKLDIHLFTAVHRLIKQHMKYPKVLELGIKEKNEYKIGYYTGESGIELKEAFCKIIRDYMRKTERWHIKG